MKRNMKKSCAAALAGMLAAAAFAQSPAIVRAEGASKDEQLKTVQEDHKIPYTEKTEKAIDGTFLSVTGFAGVADKDGKVNDRSDCIGTEAYCQVHTEEEFLEALQNARGGSVKVIEICEDLYLGWNELSSAAKACPLIQPFEGSDTYNAAPYSNPSFIESGVSLLEIDGINGLTIFSKGGNKINHVTIKLQAGVNDLVIRNLEFTDVWDWRDQRTKGYGNQGTNTYTKLPYLKVNGAKNVWIDHCNFSISYLGNTDLENGASGISFTWCNIGDTDYSVGSMLYKTIAYMEELYQQNKKDSKIGVFKIYKIMRDNQMEPEDIVKYMSYESLTHLCGAGDPDSWWIDKTNDNKGNTPFTVPDLAKTEANEYISTTFAYNHWTNMGSRLPLMRGGVAHLVNCVTDNTPMADAQKIMQAKETSNAQSIADKINALHLQHAETNFMYRGQNARDGASVAADTCVYKAVDAPMIGRESENTKAEDSNYQLNTDGFTIFGYNHSLIVNSKVSKPGSDTFYTGSSWDSNGENDFVHEKLFTWNKDKATLGNWSWGKPMPAEGAGTKDWQGYRPGMEDTDGDGEVELPYSYKTFPLQDVEENVNKYAGAYTLNMTEEEWLKTTYTETEIPDIEAKLVDPDADVPIEKIELSKGTETTIYLKEEFLQLDAHVYPSHTTEKAADFIWKSSDPEVATVNDCGLVIPKQQGETNITVTTPSGKTASCKVTVGQLPSSIEITKPSNNIYVGDTFTVGTSVTPADSTDKSVEWRTESTCIVLVDAEKGIFKAVASGKSQAVTVTARAKGNRLANEITKSASFRINIRYGDVNQDTDVNLKDAQYVLRLALKIDDIASLSQDQLAAADVIGDSDGITLKDGQAILKRALRIPVTFDQEK